MRVGPHLCEKGLLKHSGSIGTLPVQKGLDAHIFVLCAAEPTPPPRVIGRAVRGASLPRQATPERQDNYSLSVARIACAQNCMDMEPQATVSLELYDALLRHLRFQVARESCQEPHITLTGLALNGVHRFFAGMPEKVETRYRRR